MSDAPENLTDLYIDELQDLHSANDQMQRVVKKMAGKASDQQLKDMLGTAQEKIAEHTAALKELIVAQGEKPGKEHCKGMEGLVEEAKKHVIDEGPDKGPVRDAVIIAQYQRMSHYGLAGFGTAAAFADALGLKAEDKQLKAIVKDIYQGDQFGTRLAETTVNIDAREEEAAEA